MLDVEKRQNFRVALISDSFPFFSIPFRIQPIIGLNMNNISSPRLLLDSRYERAEKKFHSKNNKRICYKLVWIRN